MLSRSRKPSGMNSSHSPSFTRQRLRRYIVSLPPTPSVKKGWHSVSRLTPRFSDS